MEKFGKSQSVKRVEDQRFLTGQGRYIDDIAPEGALYALFLRSPVAHGTITTLDMEDARAMPGVHAVWGGTDLQAAGVEMDCSGSVVPNRDGTKGARPLRPVLALDRVRFVGEQIAVVVAETLDQARDAVEAILLDIDDLPVHMALATGGEALHAEAPENLAFDFGLGHEDETAAALKGAAHVVRLRVDDNRIICNSMEPRGYYAEMKDGRLHVAQNGQGVWGPKSGLARILGMDAADIRVTNPDTGGGFGMKGMNYPEMYVVAFAARELDAPVRWMSDRTEAMLTDNAGRDLVTEVTIGFDADHRIVGYHLDSVANMGAHNSQFAQHILSGWDLRRKNFIKPEAFPYTTVSGVTYDVGNFAAVLDRVEATADLAGFVDRKAASASDGKLRGVGLCFYIESILGSPEETTRVDFADGGARIYVGTQSNGQGHETVFGNFLSDHSGIPLDRITFVQGDSDEIAKGGGTGGSRSATVQNTATLKTVEVMVAAFSAFLADHEGVETGDVSFDDERFRVKGSNLSPTMLEVADLAREAGREDLLSHSATITLDGRSFPNGAHMAEVEVDPETGVVSLVKYTVVDDFGNLLNPMIVEGQIHGGVAQGLGQALKEHVVYDEDGQLLTATFMDYGMPLAEEMPMVGFSTQPTPSVYNPLGMKGCGEAGTVGALAAVANAVLDAVWDTGVREIQMPFTPHRVWQTLQSVKEDSAAA
ncbi:MAG: xanthine dehydrogenase family protein molybdopterin-binding subunit [Loktanella sp.]|nr:xanthine dehydrogenase family protein molybdopterin-binding subunit [Loktanella sp.]